MPDLMILYETVERIFPFESMQMLFMQKAMIGLLVLSPMVAIMGVQVVNFRMAFFADAISHSAFSGVAVGLIAGISPKWTMPFFALLMGLGIIFSQRFSMLSKDTVIGVFFSGIIAFGLAVVSRDQSIAKDIQPFLYGDILTLTNQDIWMLIILFLVVILFQLWGFNRMLYIGLNPVLAKVHRVRVSIYQYAYAGLLSLLVISAVRVVGVLLVTALLIVPAATARNLAKSAGYMVWLALLTSMISSVIGLLVSAEEWAGTATGATIILVSFLFFLVTSALNRLFFR